MDFSETIAACDLKVGRYRQPIEIMKVCESGRSRSFLYHIFSRFCMFCALLGQDIKSGELLQDQWSSGFKFSPIDLLIILYQQTKFEAPSCYNF